jgi:predicted Zn-dependent peptidase
MLRERTGLFYNAFGGWAAGAGKEVGINYLGAILNPDKVDYAEREMFQLIDELAAKGVQEYEVKAAQQLYLKTLIDAVSTNNAVADLLTMLQAFDLGFDYYDKILKRVQAMPTSELNAIAKKYFTTQGFARVRVGRVK